MNTNVEINSTNMSNIVIETFKKCLFHPEDDPTKKQIVQGVVQNFAFCSDRLEENRETIVALLGNLPDVFTQGYSFLNLCIDKNGNQWTDYQAICEQLMVMGIALDLLAYCFPRECWKALPGKLPYIATKQRANS